MLEKFGYFVDGLALIPQLEPVPELHSVCTWDSSTSWRFELP